jgi:predicted AlkP superfamily phosphohydrolase/phosphomutase
MGRLPNLRSILDRGRMTEVVGLEGLSDDALWSTFSTGVGPGVHGRFMFAKHRPGSSSVYMEPRPDTPTIKPFWTELAERKVRSVIVDVPKSPFVPADGVTEVVDWMPHGSDSPVPSVTPSALAHEFLDRPYFDFTSCYRSGQTDRELANLADAISTRGDHRTKTLVKLIQSMTADFWLVVYAEGHCAGHHFHQLHEPRTEEEDALAASLGDVVAEQICAMDVSLGRLVDSFAEPCEVAVFSLAGMTRSDSTDLAVRVALEKLDFVWRETHGTALTLRDRLFASISERVPPALTRIKVPRDLAKCAFHAVYSTAVDTPIHLKISGRDSYGVIDPNEVDVLLDWLEEQLLLLVDDEGRPVVRKVLRCSDSFPGVHSNSHADLVAIVERRGVTAVYSPVIGSLSVHGGSKRGGDHRPGGWIVADADCELSDDPIGVAQLGRVLFERAERGARP